MQLKAVHKWFELELKILKQKSIDFKNKILSLVRIKQGIKQYFFKFYQIYIYQKK